MASGWKAAGKGLCTYGDFRISQYVQAIDVTPDGMVWRSRIPRCYRSTDGGYTWEPRSSITLYRIMQHHLYGLNYYTTPDRPAGLYRSSDDALTWQLVDTTMGIFGVAPDGTLWKSIGMYETYRSTDRGATWEKMIAGLQEIEIGGLAASGDELFATRRDGQFGYAALDRYYGLFHSTRRGMVRNRPDSNNQRKPVCCHMGESLASLIDINREELPAGSYIIRMTADGKTRSGILIVR